MRGLARWLPTNGPSSDGVGPRSTSSWLRAQGGHDAGVWSWHCEIQMDIARHRPLAEFDHSSATRFHLDLYREEWGLFFCHRGRASWIRVTDIAFVHQRDDFGLLAHVPQLGDVGFLLRRLEASHGIHFQRAHAAIRTNVPSLETRARSWVTTL